MKRFTGAAWAVVILLILAALGMALFAPCYAEHRDAGFSVYTSVVSCGG